jgi:hypothetical protein
VIFLTALNKRIFVFLCGFIVFSGGFIYGYLYHSKRVFPYRLFQQEQRNVSVPSSKRPLGDWRKAGANPHSKSKEELEKFASLGYLAGYDPASGKGGVLFNDRKFTQQGVNFYTSGHGPEAILMDMDGKVLHRWQYDYQRVWPDLRLPKSTRGGQHFWRRAYLYPNGDVLAIFDSVGAIKIDKNSNLLWSYSGLAHHDLEVLQNGTIYLLTKEEVNIPGINNGKPVIDDFITIVDSDGKEKRKISIISALLSSTYSPSLARGAEYDVLHTNTIEVLDGRFQNRADFFKQGNVLVSLNHLDMIAIIDMQKEKVVWALSGMWRVQHQPTMLDNGHMLIFDNRGKKNMSRILEFDPLTQEIFWSYEGNSTEKFFSHELGSVQRLANGNTLVTESTTGRAFEVTPHKKIVWEFLNPHRAGTDQSLIATLCEIVRLPVQFPLEWLQK